MPDRFIDELIDAIKRREWWAVRRLLLALYVPGVLALIPYSSILDPYRIHVFVCLGVIFLVLLWFELRARPRSSAGVGWTYTRTIKGLVSFGEDDTAEFARLGRGPDISKVLNALLDRQFRFGEIFAESGCGKTSLLCAGVVPELRKRGYVCHIDDINNQEQPLDLVTRLVCSDATASSGVSPPHAWLSQFDTSPRPVFLILDQFEQFFVHYGREEQKEPFLSFLEEWWTRHPASQLRILVSIREDYLGKLAMVQERLAYPQTIHNHLRLRKFRPEEATDVIRSMAAESRLQFHEAAVVKACREDLASREDGGISPVDLQILAKAVIDLPDGTASGFTADALQSLGGLQGALERYLLAQLSSLSASRKAAALAILRLLSELREGVLAGWLSPDEITGRLAQEYGEKNVREMIGWLADPRVRLIVEKDTKDGNRYRLVHDRLVAAVRKVSGKVLEPVERASLLLDQRVTEYLNNHRRSRFLLPWKEWRFIRRHLALVEWGGLESEKRELLRRTGRRVKAWGIGVGAFVMLLSLGWTAWEFQPHVLLWRTQQDLSDAVQLIPDGGILSQVATAVAAAGEKAKASQLFERAMAVAQKFPRWEAKAFALYMIATAAATAGEKAKDRGLFERALAVADKIDVPGAKADALKAIAIAMAEGEKAKDPQLFERAQAVADKIDLPGAKAGALRAIATAMAAAGEKAKDPQLFERAQAVADKIDLPEEKAWALRAIATAMAAAGEKARDPQLFARAQAVADKIGDGLDKTRALSAIATAAGAAGEKAKASQLFERALAVKDKIADPEEKAGALEAIATAMAAAGEKAKASQLFERAVAVVDKIAPEKKAGALRAIATAMAAAGEKAKDPQLFERAQAVADKIDLPEEKAGALEAIATAMAAAGEKAKDPQLFKRAQAVADKIDPEERAGALRAIATAMAAAGEKAKDPQLFERALAVKDKIADPEEKAGALRAIATAVAAAGEKAKDPQLFDRALTVVDKIDVPRAKADALRAIATAVAAAGEKAKDPQLFDRALAVADKIALPEEKAGALEAIATAMAAAGEKAKDPQLFARALAVADTIKGRATSGLRVFARGHASLGNLRGARRLVQGLSINDKALVLADILLGWAEGRQAGQAPAHK